MLGSVLLAWSAPWSAAEAQLSETVRRLVVAAAQAQVAAPDRFVVETVRVAGGRLPAGDAWRVESVRGPNRSGLVQIVCAGERADLRVRLLVHGRVVGPGLRARRTLLRGEPIPAEAVELVETDWTASPEPPLREPEALQGMAPRRTLGAGRVLTAGDLAATPVVRQGEPVELVWVRPRLAVRALGRARRDGALGEVIPAENPRTGVVVLGEVQADGSLRVLRRADLWL